MRGLILLTTVLVALFLQGVSGATSRAEGVVDANTRIAYSCNGGICVIYPDGSRRQQLTRDLFIDSYPSWSPDGRTIAFTGNLEVDIGLLGQALVHLGMFDDVLGELAGKFHLHQREIMRSDHEPISLR